MITIDKEKKIRKLILENLSTRVIAERFEVSISLVRQIGKLTKIRERKKTKKKKEHEALISLNEAKRCSSCGGKVFLWPCLYCNPQAGCY